MYTFFRASELRKLRKGAMRGALFVLNVALWGPPRAKGLGGVHGPKPLDPKPKTPKPIGLRV